MAIATPEAVIRRITEAFEQRTLPRGTPVFLSHSSEVDTETIERLARETSWVDVPHGVVLQNPLALAFMTPEAFAWFLPASLVVSIGLYSESGTVTTSILTNLTPPDAGDARAFEELVNDARALGADLLDEPEGAALGADDALLQLLMARAAVLTPAEKAAVRAYLEYMGATNGADFPVAGPRQALERYWANAAPADA